MNSRELSRLVNCNGDNVVDSFKSLKTAYQAFKSNQTNVDPKQMEQLDQHFHGHSSAVSSLKRSLEVSLDPRFNRS